MPRIVPAFQLGAASPPGPTCSDPNVAGFLSSDVTTTAARRSLTCPAGGHAQVSFAGKGIIRTYG